VFVWGQALFPDIIAFYTTLAYTHVIYTWFQSFLRSMLLRGVNFGCAHAVEASRQLPLQNILLVEFADTFDAEVSGVEMLPRNGGPASAL